MELQAVLCEQGREMRSGRGAAGMRIETIGGATLINGDCREVMAAMPESSMDSIVCDPPYGLSFMGKGWDHGVPSVEFWAAALRVAKPGAHLLAFGGTRMHHRLMVAIEDAGFEIRDCIMWVFGSGFPKSHNLHDEWEGWGTALKPAWEPIIVARKPLAGTVATNVMQHGTGAMNIGGCRVPTEDNLNGGAYSADRKPSESEWVAQGGTIHSFAGKEFAQPTGRWPANLIHDGSEEVLACFPEAPGQMAAVKYDSEQRKTGNVYGAMNRGHEPSADSDNTGGVGFKMKPGARRLDAGSAARFFYCAKASRKDRNEGCEEFDKKPLNWSSGVQNPGSFQGEGTDKTSQNNHPTVKPTALMRYLCRLVTPLGGVVLDPFMGSGSTGKAALQEGFGFVGIDNDTEHRYFDIACARVKAAL